MSKQYRDSISTYRDNGREDLAKKEEDELEVLMRYLPAQLSEIEIRDLALGVWQADNEDDLIEEITAAAGWCIKSIDYDIQLK